VLVNSLVLQEAKASSEIENIVTTNDALFRAFTASSGATDAATKEVLRYREALWHGFSRLRERPVLSTSLLTELVQTITNTDAGVRNIPGTAIVNPATGETVYTPPDGERVIRDKLANLEELIHLGPDLDPLIRMALVHYQFEAIHPFFDANGRTGRIVNILFLLLNGLLDQPVLYLSRFIIQHRSDYYAALRAVTEDGAWEGWVLYMLSAVEETADFTRRRVCAIRDLMHETVEQARRDLPSNVYSKDLIELLFRQPYCKIAFLVEAGIASRNIASKYLGELVKAGCLKKEKHGKEFIYLNKALYELLSKP
jgi:Fic family protein